MKRVSLVFALLSIAALLVLAGCGGGGGGGGSTSLSSTSTATIAGTVTDSASLPVAGATVSVGATTKTTGADGKYTLSVAPGTNVVVKAQKTGFVDAMDAATVATGQSAQVDFALCAVGQSNALTAMATTQTTATDPDGAQVILPAGSVVNAAGTAVDSATVNVTTGMPSDATYADTFPGLFVGTQAGVDKAIESFGYVTIDITSGGQKCNLGAGKTAEIAIPVAPGADPGTATIDLWSLDAATGKWKFEGQATRDASAATVVYRATVTHFSTYNLDRPIESKMPLTVTVSDGVSTATKISGASVVVTSTNVDGGKWEGRGVTGADGTCRFAEIPQGSVKVVVTKGDLTGNGYGYQVDGGEMTMNVPLMQTVPKTITVVRVVGGVETPVAGASITAMGEGATGHFAPFTGTTAADGTVVIRVLSGMAYYFINVSKTIDAESWSGSVNASSFDAIPAKITMTKAGG